MKREDRSQRSQATRATLLEAARELFSRRGYSNVGTEELVKHAGLTRGALYHHFRDKRDLFRAVFRQMEGEIVSEILAKIEDAGAEDPIEALGVGIRSFLDVCEDPAKTRVGIVDAPAVLGWAEWREIGAEHGLSLVARALQAAKDAGQVRHAEVQPLAHLMLAALGEAAMFVANAKDRAGARREVEAALFTLLDSLRD
jgi:AcrR family transcriptional regulator